MGARICLGLLAAVLFSPNLWAKSSSEKIRDRRAKVAQEKANRSDCSTYEKELSEVKLSRARVDAFRKEYLEEDFSSLLDDFRLLWNTVHALWERSSEADKAFILKFRREYRYLRWYHQKDNKAEFRAALDKVREELKDDFRNFATKHFVVEAWGDRGHAFQLRRTLGGRVFPYGSVLELDDGELVVARYAKKRVGTEYGGFTVNINIRNDIYASRKLVVGNRDNFRASPTMSEALRSARESSKVDEDSADYLENVTRLELLLDPRFENCPAKKK